MKISLLISFLLCIIMLSASAQIERKPVIAKADSTQATGNDNKIDKQSRKERFNELDLTIEQKSKLKEIMQANKAAKEAIENSIQLSGQDKKKQMRELQKAQMQKIQAILTPEQIEKFKASKPNDP